MPLPTPQVPASAIAPPGVAPEVSVVLPCLNEAQTLPACIGKALAAFAASGLRGEIVVADNGSSDGSREIAVGLGARVIAVSERGYGATLRGGIAAALGDLIVMADADDSYDLGELHKFVDELRRGADLVMGSRFPRAGGRIEPGAMPFLHRWLGTPVLTAISRLFFGTRISDVNCGMRGLRKDAFARLQLQMTGMELASEMVIKAALLRLKVSEVPITLHRDGRNRRPHVRTWRDGWRHLRLLLLFSPRWLFAVPGFTMMGAGGVALVRLAIGSVTVGEVVFATNSMLVAAMVLILGSQLVLLGVFAKSFVVAERLLLGSKLDRIGDALRMEAGIAAGFLLFLAGGSCVAWAVALWQRTGFGPLPDHDTTRLVVFGVTLIVLGVQITSAGFFLGVLALRRRPPADHGL